LAHRRQKSLYDRTRHGESYRVGDRVWLHPRPAHKRGTSPKLHKPWFGPFVVVIKLSEVNYKIQLENGQNTFVVHFDRLKPCLSDPDVYDRTRLGHFGRSTIVTMTLGIIFLLVRWCCW
jgi:ribosomal protein L21E